MQILVEKFAFVVLPVAMALFVAMLVTHDRVIRHVCQNEGLKYPVLWPFYPSWMLRFGESSWFQVAKNAPYFKLDVTLFVVWMILMVSCLIFMVSGFIGGLISFSP